MIWQLIKSQAQPFKAKMDDMDRRLRERAGETGTSRYARTDAVSRGRQIFDSWSRPQQGRMLDCLLLVISVPGPAFCRGPA